MAKNMERHIAAQAHHVRPDQRYSQAIERNVGFRLSRKPSDLTHAGLTHFMGMELGDLKHHVGVRQKDTSLDEMLGPWLSSVQAQAKKAGLKSTFKKRGGHAQVDGVLNDKGELTSEQITAKNLTKVAPLPGNVPIVDAFDGSEEGDTKPKAQGEKKVNPKKAARQAALEKSGTARTGNSNQKANADAKRAEFMSQQKTRQPRVFAKGN